MKLEEHLDGRISATCQLRNTDPMSPGEELFKWVEDRVGSITIDQYEAVEEFMRRCRWPNREDFRG